ncbi:MAG: aspartate kinase [SAR202 cluster bacterium]|jgi:aspartate kinase|nr:MAG: aspartate kinase [SAR202 cluster bacterium]KAA1305365.1 MAG: aspartate kinase [SAR202 cluster bacterium]MAR85674.1 aspartate kinase [Chloroflexota bacterium]MEC7733300.1 aspartate kinase [Chloroflexota bacterium]|tara:strand:- start:14210 stop:15442 length:1233 start_codon:yes stop_codon:yes gene_type:complete
MPVIVQKYGGSSLATPELIRSVASRICSAHDSGNSVIATVSAMGDSTDDLLSIASQVSGMPDLRELDVLLSTGELQSCALVAMALKDMGKNAVSLSGAQAGIRTDSSYGKAKIADIDTSRILGELGSGNIVIVAGFQGVTNDSDITTLGRGASDLTAVALAAGLNADRCEIYTDVDGIYTADPRLVSKAQKITTIGFEEMLELASYGAKMNPRSIELGMVYQVPILVASSFNDKPGTLIHDGENMDTKVGEIRNRVRGIATDRDVAKITVFSVVDRPGIAAALFDPLAESDISVDVIVQNASVSGTTDLTFTVKQSDVDRAMKVVEEVANELGTTNVGKTENLAKISIVGTGMQDSPGYASNMFRSLAQADINIEMITTSEIRITCIIGSDHVAKAAEVLHGAFELEKSE